MMLKLALPYLRGYLMNNQPTRRFVVRFLEWACKFFHWLPPHRCRLAQASMWLNDCWGLDEWTNQQARGDNSIDDEEFNYIEELYGEFHEECGPP